MKYNIPLTKLKEYRERKLGLTQKQVSNRMGLHRVKYVKVELGYLIPDLKFLVDFQRTFNLKHKDIRHIFLDYYIEQMEVLGEEVGEWKSLIKSTKI